MNWRLLILLVLVAAGCDDRNANSSVAPSQAGPTPTSKPVASLPAIVVDAGHAVHDKDQSGTPYLVKAGTSFVIDGRQFTFRDPEKLGRTPNVVRILYDQAEYSIPWPDNGARFVTADPSTMKAVKGAAFAQFSAGQRAAVGIGFETLNAQKNRSDFREFFVVWVIFD